MKPILILISLVLTNALLAQKSSLKTNKASIDSTMPNVLKGQNLGLQYKSNNGQGFDIYESGIDRMPVLMPDNNNKATLGMNHPQLKTTYQPYRKYQPEIIVPNQGFGLQKDSLLIKPKKNPIK